MTAPLPPPTTTIENLPPAAPPPITTIENLPDVILEEIFIRCDAQSLSKSMAVVKKWQGMIADNRIIHRHAKMSTAKRVLFCNGRDFTTCSLSDPFELQALREFSFYQLFLGNSNGLVLGINEKQNRFYLTNYLTRQSVPNLIRLYPRMLWPGERYFYFYVNYGFGYDEHSGDYKVLCMGFHLDKYTFENISQMFTKEMMVAVYNLTQDRKYLLDPPYNEMNIISTPLCCVNGNIHMLACTRPGNILRIMSFNLHKEIFGEVHLPEGFNIPFLECLKLRLVAIGEKLCLYGEPLNNDIWILRSYFDHNSWERVTIAEEIDINDTPLLDTITNGDLIFGDQTRIILYNIQEGAIYESIMPKELICFYVVRTFRETLVSPLLF